jgi:hypothetical protein
MSHPCPVLPLAAGDCGHFPIFPPLFSTFSHSRGKEGERSSQIIRPDKDLAAFSEGES